jgi:hypothetical protein
MLENPLTGEPPSCGVSKLAGLDTTLRQVAHPSSTANLDKSDRRYAIASKPDLRKAAAKLAAIQGER